MSVWVVSYDSGMYGSGIEAIFSTEAKAVEYIEGLGKGYTTYDYDEVEVDARVGIFA